MAYGTINADLMTTSDGVSSSGVYGFKNRIINGAMTISQRGASPTITGGGDYSVDRFYNYYNGNAFTSVQSTTAPAGYINSLLLTTTTPSSTAAYSFFGQKIEGLNITDLAWGSASAQPVTLSFWVRSSVTGIYSFSLSNSAADRAYAAQFTINSANTWEQKTTTILGDTSGTWLTTNGTGINIRWNMGTYTAGRLISAGSWQAVNADGATGSTGANTWANTNGATFYITGVQLEKGSTATSFDYRPFGTELGLCQRYYNMVANYNQNGSGVAPICPIVFPSATDLRGLYMFPVQMRATPSVSSASGSNYFRLYNGNNYYANSLIFDYGSTNGIGLNSGGGTSGATQGQMAVMFVNAAGSYLALSAEL